MSRRVVTHFIHIFEKPITFHIQIRCPNRAHDFPSGHTSCMKQNIFPTYRQENTNAPTVFNLFGDVPENGDTSYIYFRKASKMSYKNPAPKPCTRFSVWTYEPRKTKYFSNVSTKKCQQFLIYSPYLIRREKGSLCVTNGCTVATKA